MKNAIYGERSTLRTNPNRFNEQVTAYDKMGNILGLLRHGQTSATEYGLIDNLNLTYACNRLQAVKDNATHSVYGNGMGFKYDVNQLVEYLYDKNGNLTKDLNKKIAVIQYNLLNLPSQVIFVDGNVIEYEYGSDGRKLRTAHVINGVTSITDYCGNAIYENGSLKMLLNEAGYISFPDKKFHFYLKDHQGNIRVVADKDGNVEETNDYYPFGGLFTASRSVQPYKYNGKELDRKNGIDWYDYGARHYDPAIGRFTTVDPMIDKYYPLTPYGYCGVNPICHRDEEGKFINNVVGFFIGGGVDLGIQVAANLVSGNGAFDDIDWVSVGASAVEGGLTFGVSAGKTLVVKAGVAIAKNTINGIKDGDRASDIVKNTVGDVITDKIIGKTSDIVGKGVKNMVPGLGKQLNQTGNKMILSKNKATKIMEKMPGISETKIARKIATSKNGLVDASKTINRAIQKTPENVTGISMKTYKKKYEQEQKQ